MSPMWQEVGLGTFTCPALMPLSPTLEVALQQDLGANVHLELCAWISSQTCRDKLKCHTEPTAALWWLLGRTMRVGTGQTNLHTSTQEAH